MMKQTIFAATLVVALAAPASAADAVPGNASHRMRNLSTGQKMTDEASALRAGAESCTTLADSRNPNNSRRVKYRACLDGADTPRAAPRWECYYSGGIFWHGASCNVTIHYEIRHGKTVVTSGSLFNANEPAIVPFACDGHGEYTFNVFGGSALIPVSNNGGNQQAPLVQPTSITKTMC
ncbi:hypothetical protein [Streptomyces umbrinus]|uniref:hypothetical protein n=1 Tax=Streptomyces umbrinus TaxID=67370 RepID=UPI0033C94C2C